MLYESFHLPAACAVNSTIYKKLFDENADLSKADKDLIKDKVSKMIWRYCLKAETIHVPPYVDGIREYPEIEFLEVQLECEGKLKRLAEIIMRTIPYPMVIFFRLQDKVQLWLAHQRINQSDQNKNTLEEFVTSEWLQADNPLFERLDVRTMRFTNCWTLYSDLVDAVSIYHAEKLTGTSKTLDGQSAREFMNELTKLEGEIARLRNALKKETQFNRKMDMNIQIKKLETKKAMLTQEQLKFTAEPYMEGK